MRAIHSYADTRENFCPHAYLISIRQQKVQCSAGTAPQPDGAAIGRHVPIVLFQARGQSGDARCHRQQSKGILCSPGATPLPESFDPDSRSAPAAAPGNDTCYRASSPPGRRDGGFPGRSPPATPRKSRSDRHRAPSFRQPVVIDASHALDVPPAPPSLFPRSTPWSQPWRLPEFSPICCATCRN